MNIEKLLGQLFIIGFHGSKVSDSCPIAVDILTRNLGGVILFDNFLGAPEETSNIVSAQQLSSLCTDLQSLSALKLIIGIDQEGGKVRRLKEKHGFPRAISAEEMGRDTSYHESQRQAIKIGKLLAQNGVNVNFSPVADLNTNPENPVIGKLGRSFSKDPEITTKHCEIWLDSMEQCGVLGCLKHFPGHGSSAKDSHKDFVDISASWKESELVPYRKLITKNKVRAVMMGHLYHSNLDPQYPASLSARIVSGLLRQQLQFQGLVLTDDMQMKAITSRYGLLDAVVMALNAGVDMIIVGNNLDYHPDILATIFNHVDTALQQGHISYETLEKAYTRVQNFKAALS
jgi:beta-N-acetylhexosaminidase